MWQFLGSHYPHWLLDALQRGNTGAKSKVLQATYPIRKWAIAHENFMKIEYK